VLLPFLGHHHWPPWLACHRRDSHPVHRRARLLGLSGGGKMFYVDMHWLYFSPKPCALLLCACVCRYTAGYVVVAFLGLWHPWVYGFLLLDLIIRSSLLKVRVASMCGVCVLLSEYLL
jgi:hypothetical protein